MREMPAIATSAYASHAVNLNHIGGVGQLNQTSWQDSPEANDAFYVRQLQALQNHVPTTFVNKEEETMGSRRLVQVFIADPNENVPLDQALLYSGEQKFTDATDQELFFEIDINNILKKYNEKRMKFVDKKVKERVEHLEPAKIRDLKMVVVAIASF